MGITSTQVEGLIAPTLPYLFPPSRLKAARRMGHPWVGYPRMIHPEVIYSWTVYPRTVCLRMVYPDITDLRCR
jgi:hypothetical protein